MDISNDILPLLDQDEKVLSTIKQRKYRPALNIETATITNKRAVLRRPSMIRIRKINMDYSYFDIANNVLDSRPLWSTIMPNLRMEANDLMIGDVQNEMAQRAFPEGIDKARGTATNIA